MTVVDDELDDLLPAAPTAKGRAAPLVRTKKQQAAAAKAAQAAQDAADLAVQTDAAKAAAARLAQIVNLHIAGYSLADIGAQIGATEQEVDRMLANDVARYVKSQPSLRIYVRNFISGKYMKMIEADWDEATDPSHPDKLDNQDRVMRMLDRMAKLHGAEAPTQAEVKVDAAPEAVEKLVSALAASQGLGYNANIFDTVPGTVVHEAAEQSERFLETSADRVGESDGNDSL